MTESRRGYAAFSNFTSGGLAGLTVDIILFPVDTIKTRLQSPQGFRQAGGFRSIYSGLGIVSAGSVPSAALFFLTYEHSNLVLGAHNWSALSCNMFAACAGEFVACLIRVPVEVVKQRAQVQGGKSSSFSVIKTVFKSDGLRGFYRGFSATIFREIPFALIQYPLWERLRKGFSPNEKRHGVLDSALAGFLAGGFAAFITTPFDVIKTRTMLSTGTYRSPFEVAFGLCKERRPFALFFSGAVPRTFWISIGGFIFLGSYQLVHNSLNR